MKKALLLGMSGLWLTGCFGGGDDNGGGVDAGPVDNGCSLNAEVEGTPGFPFEPGTFRNSVWPMLVQTCGAGTACHGEGNPTTYTVFPDNGDECNFAKSFNEVYEASDFKTNPTNSLIITSVNGGLATHPINLAAANQANLDILVNYVQAAFDAYAERFGSADPSTFFDLDVYSSTIQPMLDAGGCLNQGCHTVEAQAGTLGLTATPAAGSPEMEANFKEIVKRVSISLAPADYATTLLYNKAATNTHFGVVNDPAALQAWIQAGLTAAGGNGNTNPPPVAGCVDVSKFNVNVFRDEILPILRGDVDLNDRDGGRTTTGCARSACHGADRGPGSFYLNPAASPEDQLKSLSCFVDLANPSASQALVCPLGLSRCAKAPHPGQDVFFGVQDFNYGRILAYFYAAAQEATPLDFAFFVRNINPIFNDEAAVQDGALGLTCADTQGCHGVQFAGQDPPNGSNFGIIPEASFEQDLVLNFLSAANFTHFPEATQSSLFLYPTNEIANVDNPLATGLPHPGGKDFEVDDAEALAILQWAGGLRPDGQGKQLNWLVAGTFNATQVTDERIPGEDDPNLLKPSIFDPSGQPLQFNQGLWDGFFSNDAFVDLNVAFPQAQPSDRIAYVLAYFINTDGQTINTVISVESPNQVELFVGNSTSLGLNGNANVTVPIPSYGSSKQVTRILLKVFQRAADAQFGFEMTFADDRGNLLTDIGGELVFKLGPEGGI